MKIFPVSTIRDLDTYTIRYEPISSINLMDRASTVLFNRIKTILPNKQFCVFAGPGNNGGDALFVAQKLLNSGSTVRIYLCNTGKLSADCVVAKNNLLNQYPNSITEISTDFLELELQPSDVIIDGLFGSGLSRPLDGLYLKLVNWINQQSNYKLSIDVPSGLSGEELCTETVVCADTTLSLQFPKLSFFYSEHQKYLGDWEVLDIKLHPDAIYSYPTTNYYCVKESLIGLLKKRDKFSHKGSFGNVLLYAGKKGMAGASVLAAKAVLKSGAGLVYVAGPECNRLIVQTALPESIFIEVGANEISEVCDFSKYKVLAFGPGVGLDEKSLDVLKEILYAAVSPLILDADGLNLIAQTPQLIDLVPPESVLTPHPGEFDRLFGKSLNSKERLEKLRKLACEKQLYIVLKGANTAIACPDGNLIFNSTGNSGLATAGSGDVLTGMIAGLIAQQLPICDAVRLAVYLHGLSADLALQIQTEETFIASDIFNFLPLAFNTLK